MMGDEVYEELEGVVLVCFARIDKGATERVDQGFEGGARGLYALMTEDRSNT